MISTYDFQVDHCEMFSHLSLKDLCFLHYKYYPQKKKIEKLFTHFNNFILTLEGKKMIFQFANSYCKKNVNELAYRIDSAISEIKYHRSL